jgi:hypothetical protein
VAALAQPGKLVTFVLGLPAAEAIARHSAVHANFLALYIAIAIAIGGLRGSCASKHHQGAQKPSENHQFGFHDSLLGNEGRSLRSVRFGGDREALGWFQAKSLSLR